MWTQTDPCADTDGEGLRKCQDFDNLRWIFYKEECAESNSCITAGGKPIMVLDFNSAARNDGDRDKADFRHELVDSGAEKGKAKLTAEFINCNQELEKDVLDRDVEKLRADMVEFRAAG